MQTAEILFSQSQVARSSLAERATTAAVSCIPNKAMPAATTGPTVVAPGFLNN
jgi:hypothetical protein